MKGVSAVIAIILILMIVVALAALAYTWFTGIFADLTGTAGTAVTQTTSRMALQFSLESASCIDPCASDSTLTVAIRNTGSADIVADSVAVYMDGIYQDVTCPSGVAVDSVAACAVTTNVDATCGSSIVRATIGSGVESSTTLVCS
jgi:FlaG/FlaF family flagellin (archaellin)